MELYEQLLSQYAYSYLYTLPSFITFQFTFFIFSCDVAYKRGIILQVASFLMRLLQKQMQSQPAVTHINGVDVSDYHSVKLSKDKFVKINYEQYPKEYSHQLIHAIQFQNPIPSIKSMQRTEKRNKAKAITGEDSGLKQFVHSAKRMKRPSGGRKRVPRGLLRQQSDSSLIKPVAQQRITTKHIKARSPEWIALKTSRQHCQEQLKTWFQAESDKDKSDSHDVKRFAKSELPMYFKKKNKSHSRRIKQRWQLIKANREKLIQIFGYQILNQACRVGIKEIKNAIGLIENGMNVEGVREFMEMVDESSGSSSSSNSPVPYS